MPRFQAKLLCEACQKETHHTAASRTEWICTVCAETSRLSDALADVADAAVRRMRREAGLWHLAEPVGRTVCGADYRNMQTTNVLDNVTCAECERLHELHDRRQRAIGAANVRAQTRNEQ